jgi:phosphohistidine swiveling domain-containing protein
VKKGEIMVCKMTNPAWVVVFTKIKGLVTDSGGVLAHPAVVSREFGIPAVVGTSVATEKIKTGMRIRVNGNTGVVEIIGASPPAPLSHTGRGTCCHIPPNRRGDAGMVKKNLRAGEDRRPIRENSRTNDGGYKWHFKAVTPGLC